MAEYLLPDVGEGLTEAEIVSWKVKVGDTVEINDIVVEIETAKSLVELPSPYAGTVTGLLVPEGETVPVGTPIIAIGDPSEVPADGGAAPAPRRPRPRPRPRSTSTTRAPAAAARARAWSAATRRTAGRSGARARAPRAAQLVRRSHRRPPAGPGGVRGGCRRPRWRAPTSRPSRRPPPAPPTEPAPAEARALAKPPVRKLAKDLGVDITTLTPTGPERHGHPRGRRAGRGSGPAASRLRRTERPSHLNDRRPASASAASRSRACAR